ncbi:MAG TPA: nucleotidyltransferase family protein [Candidatus Paceibacterota bacterium]
MKGVILVGGMGTRLRPVTYEIPKPLIPVQKKPITNHLIDLFHKHGINDVALLAARIHEDDFRRWQKAWDDHLTQRKVSIFYEEKPRGTLGGFELLKGWLNGERFVVTNGDDLKDVDFTGMIDLHEKEGALATLALIEVPDARSKGVPIREGNKIVEFLEKPENPPSNWISAGTYILEPETLDMVDFGQEYLMIEKDLFPKLAKQGKLAGFEMINSRWYDCGTLENWEKAIKEWE